MIADSPTTSTAVSLEQKLDSARTLRGLILRHRERPDEARQVAPPVVEAMGRLGLFRALVPASAGGEEWAWPTWMTDVELIDTRSAEGMRRIGSHDFAVRECLVPTAFTVNAADDAPLHPGPLYRLPVVLTLCSGLGALALGFARGAKDGFAELVAA
jgi:alkylation response protein AidB-like acyl-CoA dehydrogenase